MTQYFGFIEAIFTLVVVFGFGLWQLWSVNKAQAEDRAAKEREAAASKADQADRGIR